MATAWVEPPLILISSVCPLPSKIPLKLSAEVTIPKSASMIALVAGFVFNASTKYPQSVVLFSTIKLLPSISLISHGRYWVAWLFVTVTVPLASLRAHVSQPSSLMLTRSGAKRQFSMVTELLVQPTKPPLWLLLLPSKLPSNLLLRMVTLELTCASPTKPPIQASPFTLLLSVTEEWQFSIVTV